MKKKDLKTLVKAIVYANKKRIEMLNGSFYETVGHDMFYVDAFTQFKSFVSNAKLVIDKVIKDANEIMEANKNVSMLTEDDKRDVLIDRCSDIFYALVTMHETILIYDYCIKNDKVFNPDYTSWIEESDKIEFSTMENRMKTCLKDSLFGSERAVNKHVQEIADVLFSDMGDLKNNKIREAIVYLLNKLQGSYNGDNNNVIGEFVLGYIESTPAIHYYMNTASVGVVRNFMCTGDRDTFEKVLPFLKMNTLNTKEFKKYKPVIDEIINDFIFDQELIAGILAKLSNDNSIKHIRDGKFLLNETQMTQAMKDGLIPILTEDLCIRVNSEIIVRGLPRLSLSKFGGSSIGVKCKACESYMTGQVQMLIKAITDYVINSSYNAKENQLNTIETLDSAIEELVSKLGISRDELKEEADKNPVIIKKVKYGKSK